MFRKAKSIFFMGLLVMGCSSPLAALAKPTAPVAIEYSVPQTVKAGDSVSTIIRFVAQADLERLVVSVSPYEGLILASDVEKTLFLDVKRGETRELRVQIQLTAPEVGYLSVFATTTTTAMSTRTKSIAIRYGTPGSVTSQKLKSKRLVETPEGENLILLPGDPR